MSKYSILHTLRNEEYCALYWLPDELADPEGPSIGEPVGDDHADGQPFQMAVEARGIRVADFIRNAFGYLMVTGKAREVLETASNASIEFLRFSLIDHKGRVASDQCYIANILGTVDCVDLEKTEGDEHAFFEDRMDEITMLVLDATRIPDDATLFRIPQMPHVIIVEASVRQAIEGAALTGVEFLELGTEVELT